MRIKNRILFTLSISCAVLAAHAQNLTLDSVLLRVQRNPALLAFHAKIQAQEAYAVGATSWDAPKISAGQYQTPYQIHQNSGAFMIQAEQMFTNPGKLRAKAAYMTGLSKVTDEDRNYMRVQLISQAKQAYYERVILEKKLHLLENSQNLLNYVLKDAGIRLTYGKEKLPEIFKTKAGLFALENTREQLKNEISQKNIMLNTLMNQDKQSFFSVDTSLNFQKSQLETSDTLSLELRRSDLKSLNRTIELQQLNAKLEYSKRNPDFGIQAAHMFSYGGFPNQYILMVSMSVPIVPWAAKEYKANLRGIQHEMEESQLKKADLLNLALGKLAAIRSGIHSKERQLAIYNQSLIPALLNAYKSALQAYDQNTGDLSTVLDAVKELQQARMDALDLLKEHLILQVMYEKEDEHA